MARPQMKGPRATDSQSKSRRFEEDESGKTKETSDASSSFIYGVAPILEALRTGARPIERISVAKGANDHRLREIIELARGAHVPVLRVPRNEVGRFLDAGARHQGIVARVAAAKYADAGELIDELASRVGTPNPPLAVVLDGLEDPHNLGAILRTADCAGSDAVFIPDRRSVGLTETVAKVAAGAMEHVRVARVINLVRLIEQLQERNIWVVGSAADGAVDYTSWDWTQASAIVLGSEGRGLHRLVSERCDTLVRIPLRGRIQSLNVSVAAGVLLFEALRQRTASK